MAVFSAIKNKKNQKLRGGIEDLALKCGETSGEDAGVHLIDVNNLQPTFIHPLLLVR